MILLDASVIAEPIQAQPNRKVLAWLDSQIIETLFLPTPVLAEFLTAIEGMPQGKRRSLAESTTIQMLESLIGGRFVAFDQRAAEVHALLARKAQGRGQIVSFADCQIAAIAAVHNFIVATRDVATFLAMDIPVINPWE